MAVSDDPSSMLHAMPIGLLRCPVSSGRGVNAERRSARGWRAAPARCGAGSDRNCDSVPRSRRGTCIDFRYMDMSRV